MQHVLVIIMLLAICACSWVFPFVKNVSVYVGEFGANATPEQANFETYCGLWVNSVRQQAETKGFG